MRFLFLFLFPLLCLPIAAFSQVKKKQPNIILLVADDLGYGDLGCYGQEKIETPNINRMAAMGMRFTQFYAGTSVCAPSRASLLTGLHTGHAPVRGNKGMKPEGQYPLSDSALTFPMLLQKHGYQTAAFGKWGLGFITTSGDPAKKGIDHFYGYNCQSLAHDYYPDHLWSDYRKIDFLENQSADSIYSADLIHREAMAFLGNAGEKPFFLFLPYTLPHAELQAPRDSLYHYYIRKFSEKPKTPQVDGNSKKDVHFEPYPHAAFAAMVTRLDRYVGEMLDLMAKNGLDKNTLFLFTSDNGPHREHGGDPEFFNSNGGFRGIKRDLYEGGIRVPLIAYQKGVVPTGTTNKQALAYWDLFPTFVELAGGKSPAHIDGFSIWPALQNKKQKEHENLYWEFHEGGGRQAIRMGSWKAIRLQVNTSEDPPVELYNLEKDPWEKTNLAEQNPALVKKAKSLFREQHRAHPDFPLLLEEKK
jgi:arylsulfatase A